MELGDDSNRRKAVFLSFALYKYMKLFKFTVNLPDGRSFNQYYVEARTEYGAREALSNYAKSRGVNLGNDISVIDSPFRYPFDCHQIIQENGSIKNIGQEDWWNKLKGHEMTQITTWQQFVESKEKEALERKEEKLGKDLDGDGEKGESEEHKKKVFGKKKK
jgi:hypothetical protein